MGLVSILASRRVATDSALVLVGFRNFADEMNLGRALRAGVCEWDALLVPPQIGARGVSGPHVRLSVNSARARATVGALAIVPVAPDHISFALGIVSSSELIGATTHIWGRKESLGRSTATWGRVLTLDEKLRYALCTTKTLVVGGRNGGLVHFATPRRLPFRYQPPKNASLEESEEACRHYLRDNSPDGYHVIAMSEDEMAFQFCAGALASLLESGGRELVVRLTCGQALAFALGASCPPAVQLTVEVFDANAGGWVRWE